MEGLRVYPRHVQAMNMCLIPGARDWAKAHDINWRDFVRFGVPAETLLATGDAFAIRVVGVARKEAESGK